MRTGLMILALGLASLLPFPIHAAGESGGPRIGVILPLTGPFTKYGERIRKGLAQSELSKAELSLEDEGCDPKIAITAYKKLSELDGIQIFLGPWCGSPQTAVAPQIKAKRQLAVLGSSAPRDVFALSGGRMFSTQHTIEDESAFLARNVDRLGFKKVAIVFFDNQFSRAHEKAFRETYSGTVAETFAYTSQDVSELKSISLRIRQLGVDALYVPDAFPLMAGFMKELAQQGLNKLPVFSVYSSQSEDAVKAMGRHGEGFVYSYPDIGDQDALDYFPGLAAKMLGAAVSACSTDVECAKNYLTSHNQFDEYGVLKGGLKLKTIDQGKFQDFTPELERRWLESRQTVKKSW